LFLIAQISGSQIELVSRTHHALLQHHRTVGDAELEKAPSPFVYAVCEVEYFRRNGGASEREREPSIDPKNTLDANPYESLTFTHYRRYYLLTDTAYTHMYYACKA